MSTSPFDPNQPYGPPEQPSQPTQVPPQWQGVQQGWPGTNQPSPQSYPPHPYPPYQPQSRFSLLAVVSVLLGAAGMLTCCCFPVAIPASLLSVVTGHAALIFIHRSDNRLTGKPVAVLGLVTGYLGLALSAGFFVWGMNGDRRDRNAPEVEVPLAAKTADDLLNRVEDKIRTDSRGIAHGNSDEAKQLAQEFSESIQVLRDEMFTAGGKGISLSGGKFITYCELRPGQCAFVVHVPEYRKFEGDAKESLAKLAWIVGQKTAAGKLEPGDKLAVALKGVVFYGSVMVGQVDDPDGEASELEIDGDQRADLLPFFTPEEEPAGSDEPGMIELPDEAPSDKPVEVPAEPPVP